MSATLTKREAETRLWEAYRPALEYLFIVQNRTRNEIRDLMATMLGFDRRFAFPLHKYRQLSSDS